MAGTHIAAGPNLGSQVIWLASFQKDLVMTFKGRPQGSGMPQILDDIVSQPHLADRSMLVQMRGQYSMHLMIDDPTHPSERPK